MFVIAQADLANSYLAMFKPIIVKETEKTLHLLVTLRTHDDPLLP